MTLPSAEILLIAGRAGFLIFSFFVAAISITAWRRATGRDCPSASGRPSPRC